MNFGNRIHVEYFDIPPVVISPITGIPLYIREKRK